MICTRCKQDKAQDQFYWKVWRDKRRGTVKEGHDPMCKECIKSKQKAAYAASPDAIRERSKAYYHANRQEISERRKNSEHIKAYRAELKANALKLYGTSCECCGESNPAFLCIDHVANDGKVHRAMDASARNLHYWIKKHGLQDGVKLQVLCWNCNMSKRFNNGICAHKVTEGSTTIPEGSTAKRPEARGTHDGDDIVCSAA